MRSAISSRRLPLLLLGLGASLAGAACTKAKLADPVPNGIVVSADTATFSADGGTVTVRAQAFEDGVTLLNVPVTLSITGAVSAGPVVVSTSSTGFAITTFTGLHTAGSATLIAQAGSGNAAVSASTTVTVTHGAPASVTIATQNVNADVGTTTFTTTAADAFSNAIVDAPIGVSTNAPAAAIQGATVSNLHTAGSYFLYASVAGYPLVTSSASLAVAHGAAAQVVGSLGQTAVGAASTLAVYCDEKDAWGNATGGAFTAGTSVTTTPASTVALVSGNHFSASGFTTVGSYVATCTLNGHSDVHGFQVVTQSATNSIVATLNKSLVQAGAASTLTLTCAKVDGYGNPIATSFTTGNVSAGGSGAAITGSNPFTLTGFITPGINEATCFDPAAVLPQSSAGFQVVDSTPPTITGFTVIAATGPNGVTADRHYAPGTTITFKIDAADGIALANEALSVVGSAQGSGPQIKVENGGTTGSAQISIQIDASAATFATISLQAQATDRSGNVGTLPMTLTVDPAAGFSTAPGVTVRTFFEMPTSGGYPIPLAIMSSSSSIYVTTHDGVIEPATVRRIGAIGTTFTTIVSNFDPGVDIATFGLVNVPGGFGGQTLFQTREGNLGVIDAINGGVVSTFATDPAGPLDMVFGSIGGITSLAYTDYLSSPPSVRRVDSFGTSSALWLDTSGMMNYPDGLALTSGGDLLIGSANNNTIVKVNGITHQATAFTVNPIGNTRDLITGTSGKILLATGGSTVERLDSAGADLGFVFTGSGSNDEITVDASGSAFVTSQETTSWRVYKVTGY